MTRAKDHLHLMLPQRFNVHQQWAYGDRHVYAARSRFPPNAVIGHFESCAWPVAAAGPGAMGPQTAALPIDLAARVRALWR